MIVSHKHKFMFIYIPKNGGTSMRQILGPYTDLCGLHKETSSHSKRGQAVLFQNRFKEHNYDTAHTFGEK